MPSCAERIIHSPTSELPVSTECQSTINSIVKVIKSKRVRAVIIIMDQGTANQWHTGNPTNRSDSLMLGLQSHTHIGNGFNIDRHSDAVASNIMSSPVLMKTWSDKIVSNCNNIADVSFNVTGTGYTQQFSIQSDGKTQQRECASESSNDPLQTLNSNDPLQTLKWNEMFCGP